MKESIDWHNVLLDSSRKCIEVARDILIKNPKEVKNLIDLSFAQEERYSGRAIRTICYALEVDKTLFKKEIKALLKRYYEIKNESIEFHLIAIYHLTDLPKNEEDIAELTNICFNALSRKVERIAIKVYAAEILYKITLKYPDLKREFIDMLKINLEDAPPSLTSTSKRIIKDLGSKKK